MRSDGWDDQLRRNSNVDQLCSESTALEHGTLDPEDIEEQYSFDLDALARRRASASALEIANHSSSDPDMDGDVLPTTPTTGLNGAGVHLFAAAVRSAAPNCGRVHRPSISSASRSESRSPNENSAATGFDEEGNSSELPDQNQDQNSIVGALPPVQKAVESPARRSLVAAGLERGLFAAAIRSATADAADHAASPSGKQPWTPHSPWTSPSGWHTKVVARRYLSEAASPQQVPHSHRIVRYGGSPQKLSHSQRRQTR